VATVVGAGVTTELGCAKAVGAGVVIVASGVCVGWGAALGVAVGAGVAIVASGVCVGWGAPLGVAVNLGVGSGVEFTLGAGLGSGVGVDVGSMLGATASPTVGAVVGTARIRSVRITIASIATIAWPFVPTTATVS
jgi:hypothetical protein